VSRSSERVHNAVVLRRRDVPLEHRAAATAARREDDVIYSTKRRGQRRRFRDVSGDDLEIGTKDGRRPDGIAGQYAHGGPAFFQPPRDQ